MYYIIMFNIIFQRIDKVENILVTVVFPFEFVADPSIRTYSRYNDIHSY